MEVCVAQCRNGALTPSQPEQVEKDALRSAHGRLGSLQESSPLVIPSEVERLVSRSQCGSKRTTFPWRCYATMCLPVSMTLWAATVLDCSYLQARTGQRALATDQGTLVR